MGEERTGGLRRPLSLAPVYSKFQDVLGARRGRTRFVREDARIVPGEAVLDIGCGPGSVVPLLPDVGYVGIDISRAYIDAARRAHPEAEFHCTDLRQAEFPVDSFDCVIALGVIHHLDDDEAIVLMDLAASVLRPGGRLVTIDPAFARGQAMPARWMIERDRGGHVRDKQGYERLGSTRFASVECRIHDDRMRIPYTHAVLRCSRPRVSQDR